MAHFDVTSPEAFYSVFYALFAACLIAPPTEFISAGITVQNLLANFLGSETMNFVNYHIKRTAATVVFHACIPLGYLLGYNLFTTDHNFSLLQPWKLGYYWKLYGVVSLILPAAALLLIFHWSRGKWANHPIAKAVQVFVPQGSTWHSVVSSINVEFRRFDKFSTGTESQRVIVTDSWVIRLGTYRLYVAHQNDIHLTLEQAQEHELSPLESAGGVQYLTIAVRNIRPGVEPFTIRLLASDYQDLKDKLQIPVRNLRNVVIQQSLSDRFVHAFRQQVDSNPPFTKPPEMEVEQCIGCMQKAADIKLLKRCEDGEGGGEGRRGEACIQCFCRPMWCLDCMGKWFASRQKQTEPETWMGSKAPCPTCRAVFCVIDVCLLL